MKKNNLQLWMLGCWVLILSSCLGNNEDFDKWHLSNCLIKSFYLQSDSVQGLESVKFTIDQVNGLIYNKDSMPYGTEIHWKVLCIIGFEVSPSAIEVFQAITGDSASWNAKDSLDFRDYVRFDVFSQDGKNMKRYFAQLNIHQQKPDLLEWTWFSGRLLGKAVQEQKVIERNHYYWMFVKTPGGYELYNTPVTDTRTWIPVRLTGLGGKSFMISQMTEFEGNYYMPASDGALYYSANCQDWSILDQAPVVKTLLGVINGSLIVKTTPVMASIIQENNSYYFATMNADHIWEKGIAVPDAFPLAGFGNTGYETAFYWHLLVVAGKDRNGRLSNAVWETMTGLNWVCSTDGRLTHFEEREGVMLTHYDDKMYLIGGINTSNTAAKDIYYSQDRGLTWALADSMLYLPDTFRPRGFASVIVDKDNFLHLFGGKENNSANILDELWSGRINRLGFKD
ncbi:MAG: DUF6242 domain-containing protein [Tannerella sp.]|jgi:hypothetical protein|nr:DUF6242 domain-containing protein [Tannerella sp.]